MNNSKGKYYIKRDSNDSFVDITEMFDGVAVLSLDGFNERGEALNIYHAQWIDSQEEDFFVANDDNIVVRNNVDLNLTLAISRRYAANQSIDEQEVYDAVIDYMCDNGKFYIKSNYVNKIAKVVCLNGVKPTSQLLNRGMNSFILATIQLHSLGKFENRKQWYGLIDSNDNDVIDVNNNAIQMLYYL